MKGWMQSLLDSDKSRASCTARKQKLNGHPKYWWKTFDPFLTDVIPSSHLVKHTQTPNRHVETWLFRLGTWWQITKFILRFYNTSFIEGDECCLLYILCVHCANERDSTSHSPWYLLVPPQARLIQHIIKSVLNGPVWSTPGPFCFSLFPNLGVAMVRCLLRTGMHWTPNENQLEKKSTQR